tara:strand:+ start:33 stop:524 length:492 start_codon:yes stop_codon:yes gene_type:complete
MTALTIGALNMSHAQTLDSLINLNQYSCIQFESFSEAGGSEVFYIDNTGVMLKLLSDFGSTDFSPFNQNSDGVTNTSDLIKYLSGFNQSLAIWPTFHLFTGGQMFGEGNQWLDADSQEISFGWMHRTPGDEINVFYTGWDLESFRIDVIYEDGTQKFYTFIKL